VCFKKAICFTAVTLGTISFHSISISAGKGKPDSIYVSVIQHIEEFCSGNADPLPCLKKSMDVSRALYVLFAFKTPCFQQVCFHPSFPQKLHLCSLIATILIRLLLIRYSQLPASLCTAARKNHAATTSSHAGTETKFSVALYFAGLICT